MRFTQFWQTCLVALVVLLLSAPAFAGTVYVPLVADFELNGTPYRTRLLAANNSDEPATLERVFIRTRTNGTVRNGEPSSVTLAPGETFELPLHPGAQGMLEVFVPDAVQVQARLVPEGGAPGAGQGTAMPVVSSENMVAAGETAHLLGWLRKDNGAAAFSNFGLVNLGHQQTECRVSVWRADGTPVIQNFALNLQPLSHIQYNGVLAILGQANGENWRLGVTCDQPFYPYLTIRYPQTGRVVFQTAAADGRSSLERPGVTPPPGTFDYQADLPISNVSGLELGPYIGTSGADFHAPGGPIGGFVPISIDGVTYEKGISFYPKWGRTAYIEQALNQEYTRFTADVRIDDFFHNAYEWALVDAATGRFINLQRPPGGYRDIERSNPIRVGAGATFLVIGDGEVLYTSPEIHAYGPPVKIDIDVRGVTTLRLQIRAAGTEELNAPYRNGLTQRRLVQTCTWFDMIDFADGKLYR